MKIGVLFANGFEEVEALGVVDVLRRANYQVDLIGMTGNYQTSSHQITVKMDIEFENIKEDYDGIYLPGGLPGATNLQKDQRVIDLVNKMYQDGKLISAICAGPIVLETAGVIKNHIFTCSPGFESQIPSGKYIESIVQVDRNIITGKGPAAAFAVGYKILEYFNDDSEQLKNGMQYNYLKNNFQ